MATIKIIIDKRSKRLGDTYSLAVYVSRDGVDVRCSTGIAVTEKQWNGKTIVKHPAAFALNQYLNQIIERASNAILLSDMKAGTTKTELSSIVQAAISGKPTRHTPLLSKGFERKMQECNAEQTRLTYVQTLSLIESFAPEEGLTFEDVTVQRVKDFDSWMKNRGLSVNTRAIHMRNLRSVFNNEINNDNVDANLYPFRKYKIRIEPTRKRSLTIEQLRQLRDVNIDLPQIAMFRDLFMLSFYLIGINQVDLLNAKKSDVTGDRFVYMRSKTKKMYNIKIEPEARQIMDRMRGDVYLLNILERYSSYDSFYNNFKHRLKQVPGFDFISPYWARHTWATVAYNIDIEKDTISQALGHSQGIKVTDTYINYNAKKVDTANRRVLDAVISL